VMDLQRWSALLSLALSRNTRLSKSLTFNLKTKNPPQNTLHNPHSLKSKVERTRFNLLEKLRTNFEGYLKTHRCSRQIKVFSRTKTKWLTYLIESRISRVRCIWKDRVLLKVLLLLQGYNTGLICQCRYQSCWTRYW
jgi:hypothetical protein